jgi:hypothetical protein
MSRSKRASKSGGFIIAPSLSSIGSEMTSLLPNKIIIVDNLSQVGSVDFFVEFESRCFHLLK